MIALSAFADEISADLDEQVAVLQSEGIHHLDLRSVWNTNVLDLSGEHASAIKRTLDAAGILVAAIGSPLGKVPIDTPFDVELARLDRAVDLAHFFETPLIRIFSFHPPAAEPGLPPETYRDEALRRVRVMAERAADRGITLLHENDTGLYGDTIARTLDVLRHAGEAGLQAVFDPQNLVNAGDRPYPDGYEAFRPWIRYVHVKDVIPGQGNVAAGEGVAGWPEILDALNEDGYDGMLSLEPHLASAGRYAGFSGPNSFRHASRSLKRLLDGIGWEYQ